MKLIATRHAPHYLIQLSRNEVHVLEHCARNHYDGVCRGLINAGGMIAGFRNRLFLAAENESIEVELSRGDVDQLCKVLEALRPLGDRSLPTEPGDLYYALQLLLDANDRGVNR